MAKAISGGVIPFGAVWTSKGVSNYFDKNKLVAGLTNYAHPLGMAALNNVIKLTAQENFQKLLKTNITTLKNYLCEIEKIKYVKKCRQAGLLGAIDTNLQNALSWKFFINKGFYLSINSDNTIIIAPALNIETDLFDKVLSKFLKVLKELSP